MADNPDQIKEIDEKGFPQGVKSKLNELICLFNRPTEYKFATDSLNPQVDVKTSKEKRVVTLPRAPAGQKGKFDSPYTLGQNSTTTGKAAANDSWTLASGPSPAGGGPYTGVQGPLTRYFADTANATQHTFTDDDGAHVTILITPVFAFYRPVTADSLGNWVVIGEEEGDLGGPSLSNVQFL